MSRDDAPEEPNLAATAQTLEAELRKIEETVREAEKVELTSDKALQKARRLLETTSSHQLRMAELLRDLVIAMQSAQGRMQSTLDRTLEVSKSVAGGAGERDGVYIRFADLGRRTRDIQEPVAVVLKAQADGAPPDKLLQAVNVVMDVADALVVDAEALSAEAKESRWTDIAKEADGLRQQLLAARNKVMLLRRSLSEKSS
jgi:hypothetical protein